MTFDWRKFNINHNVKVKLTNVGRKIHRDQHDELYGRLRRTPGAMPFEYTSPREDADGWSTWQLWVLMETFGNHMGMGAEVPFETEILVEMEDDLREHFSDDE
jgi:hypothetical protein